jgi:hypothetical protein
MKSGLQKSLSFSYKINFNVSIFNCRFALKHEEQERRNVVRLSEETEEQLRE